MTVYSQQAQLQLSMYEQGQVEGLLTYLFKLNGDKNPSTEELTSALKLINFSQEAIDYWVKEFSLTNNP